VLLLAVLRGLLLLLLAVLRSLQTPTNGEKAIRKLSSSLAPLIRMKPQPIFISGPSFGWSFKYLVTCTAPYLCRVCLELASKEHGRVCSY
jgi:hypothetical protein